MYRLLTSLLFVFLLVGCSSGAENGSGNDNGESTLNIAYMAQPPNFDPHFTDVVAIRDIARNVFETLVSFDEQNDVVPLLAESYEMNDDGTEIVFQLRKDVKFHNGQEMTADDVVASMERWRTLSPKASSYFTGSEFVKEDDYTVVLRMDQPMPIAKYLLGMNTNFGAIMPKEVIENADTNTGIKEFIGTGPFEFVDWKQDQYIQLAKNDAYTSASDEIDGLVGKREPLVDHVYFHFVQDPATRTAGIQTGEYDIALAIPSDNVEQLKTDSNLGLYIADGGYTTAIFNKKKGLFSDKRAREAVNLAVDKEEVMISAFTSDEFYRMEHGLLGEDYVNWHNDAGVEAYEAYDPEKAKQLLKEAGYNGETIRILSSRDYEDQYHAGVVVQQKLEQIGMKVDLEVYDWPTLLQKRADENAYEMYMFAFAPATDPTQIQYIDSKQEYPGWTDSPELDALLAELMVAPTDEEAKEVFTALQEETWNELPAIKYGEYNRVTVTHGDLPEFKFFHGPVIWNVSKN